jgi:Na+/melibiose symporter-like transporter
MRASWRVLARHRDLRLMLSAGLASRSGDWILLTGLLYRVYAMTGSTVASALTMLSAFLPQVLIGPVAGVFADRWNRKLTMIAADLLLAAGLLPLLAVRGRDQIWVVFAVLVWEGVIEQFFSPAQLAMVPRLVPDDQLVAANALSGQAGDISRLAGSVLGGLIAATAGITGVALADAASFAASAALLALIRTSGAVQRTKRHGHPVAAVTADLRDGLRLAARHRLLRALIIFGLITSVGEGIVGTLFAPFFRHVLHGSSQAFGLFMAAQAIGGIAGGALAASLGQRVSASRLLSYGAITFGVVDLAIFLYPLGYIALWPAMAGIIMAGLPAALTTAGLLTLFQQNTEDSYRGRAFGAFAAAEGIAVMAGTLAAGYLTQPFGIIPVIAIQGAGYLTAGLLTATWLPRVRQHTSRPSRTVGWQQDISHGASAPARRETISADQA